MDAVRFGRVLGFGARQAAKTLVKAADAATAENPLAKAASARANTPPVANHELPAAATRSAPPKTTGETGKGLIEAAPGKAAKVAAETVVRGRNAKQALGRGGKRFGQATWEPVARLSGVLWLEVSGSFFGIFALTALGAVWRMRGSWHTGAPDHNRLLGAVGMALVFGYFCGSNFVRAKRRERRP